MDRYSHLFPQSKEEAVAKLNERIVASKENAG
jgi:hypothetical protein